jgi:hypothetical protein
MQRALVSGIHSYIESPTKVGIQYIAEGLSSNGWGVDYLSIFSSFSDLIRPKSHFRWRLSWLRRIDLKGRRINQNLHEYAFRAPFSASKYTLRYKWQMPLMKCFTPDWFKSVFYDVYIQDITANTVFLPLVKANIKILRLNDLPEGFNYRLSPKIISFHRDAIKTGYYDEIWAAHTPLVDYVKGLNDTIPVIHLENGVDDRLVSPIEAQDPSRSSRSAIYLGGWERWLDFELIQQTARLLNDWQFDIIGQPNDKITVYTDNIRLLPSIPREEVPARLAQYQVGLIPFKNIRSRLDYVEKPIKFYEYLGAGLGVASTDVGALKSGMREWASYGNTPETFAEAIQIEALRSKKRTPAALKNYLESKKWSKIIEKMCSRIHYLKQS